MHFNDLPLELKFRVFSYLTQVELMQNVAPVCHDWYKMAYDPSLWKSLEIQSMDFMNFPELVKRLLTKFSGHITDLTLSLLTLTDWGRLVWKFTKSENLKKLYLDNCTINSIILYVLVNNFPFIQELSLDLVQFDDGNLFFKTNRWKKLKKIHINFTMINENNDIANSNIINFIAENFEDLIDITLSDINPSNSSFRNLGNLKGRKLSKFSLHNCHITDTNFINLGELFTNLTELDFSYCRFNGHAFLAVKNLINLRLLQIIQCTGLQVNDFVRFFNRAIFFKLTVLVMKTCSLNDDVMKLLPQCFPALETFHLVNSKDVTETGLNSAISHFRNLNYVKIRHLYVTGKCFLNFPPNLSYLDISECPNITDETENEISSQRRSVKIHRWSSPSLGFLL